MAKQIVPISIKNSTFKINLLHVELIAIKHFNVNYQDSDKKTQSKIKEHIRELVIDKNEISAQIIEDNILLENLPKKLQKELKNLAYLQGI